jgi:hypothetical protein
MGEAEVVLERRRSTLLLGHGVVCGALTPHLGVERAVA